MKTILFIDNTAGSARPAGVSIHKLGIHERIPPKFINRPSGTDDYLFMHFHDPAVIKAGRVLDEYPAGTMVIWSPGAPHYYGHPDNQWNHTWVHAAGTDIGAFLAESSIPANTPFLFSDIHVTEKYALSLHGEVTGHGAPDGVILRNIIHNWIREISRAVSGEQAPPIPRRILDVKTHLETHFGEPATLESLAAMSFLSIPHFCAEFKKHVGSPAIDYLVNIRMQQAAFRLADVNMSITQVAQSVGYDDIYYFSRLFKKHHKKSPRDYRAGLHARGPGCRA